MEKLLEGLITDQNPRGRQHAVVGAALIAAVAALGFTYLALDRLWISKRSVVVQAAVSDAQLAASRAIRRCDLQPPAASIAVLPFVNMSGDKKRQYFSDGLTEELLDSLSRINELQVAARTSSFSFQGEHPGHHHCGT